MVIIIELPAVVLDVTDRLSTGLEKKPLLAACFATSCTKLIAASALFSFKALNSEDCCHAWGNSETNPGSKKSAIEKLARRSSLRSV